MAWSPRSLPEGCVDAAVAAQRALELPVRMGIATGEAEAAATVTIDRYSTALRGDGSRARRSDSGGGLDGWSGERS